jgi:hypothetical protein
MAEAVAMSYDSWLEAPYQRMYAEGDAFVFWCEQHDVDPDADDAWDRYESDVADAREAAAEARAEAMAEREWLS